MPPAKKTTALANYDAELAKLAQQGAKTASFRSGTANKNIGTSGAHFTVNGVTLKETKLNVVVADFILMNAFYDPSAIYDPKNPQSPICFAFGYSEDEMTARVESSQPQGEGSHPTGRNNVAEDGAHGSSCVGCPQNEWGSAAKGKGKACKNMTRLGLLTADSITSADSIAKAEAQFITVPVTSGRAWASHEANVRETLNVPVLAVVTEIEISPAEGGGHRLDFQTVEEVDKKVIGPLLEKQKRIAKEIDYPFVKQAETPAQSTQSRTVGRAPAKKSAAVVPAKAVRGTKY